MSVDRHERGFKLGGLGRQLGFGKWELVASDAEGIEESGCVKLSIREGGALKEDFIYKLKQGFGEGDRQAKFVGAPG